MDAKITQAIEEAVAEAGEDPAVARRLTAWMNAITTGNEGVNDVTSALRHLDGLYGETSSASLHEATDADGLQGGLF